MDPKFAFDPQFHGIHMDPEAAPMGGARNLRGHGLGLWRARTFVRNPESARLRAHRRDKYFSGLHHFALPAGPGAEPALPGVRTEVRVIVGIRQWLDSSLGANLAMTVIPMKYDGCPRILLELAPLA